MLVLDTCALLEIFKEDHKGFSGDSLQRIQNEETHILSISFAEIACKVKIGKLVLNLSVEQMHSELILKTNIQVIDIGFTHWIDSIGLDWFHRDPADRLILAYAEKVNADIVTSDQVIKKKYKRVVW